MTIQQLIDIADVIAWLVLLGICIGAILHKIVPAIQEYMRFEGMSKEERLEEEIRQLQYEIKYKRLLLRDAKLEAFKERVRKIKEEEG